MPGLGNSLGQLIPSPEGAAQGMKLKTFFDKFDQFADAPDAVAKMRELVLGLAIKGKLVNQHSKEGLATELVSKASAVRAKLIAEKKLRKPRMIESVAEFDRSEIPSSWTWTTLHEITEIGPRNDVEDSTQASFLPMPAIPRQYGGKLIHQTRPWSELKKGFTHLADGDIALAKITPCFQNGKSAVIEGLENGIGAGTTELHVARPFAPIIEPYYVWVFLSSPQFLLEGIPHMTGSAGQKRVPTGYFACKPFPLPPLAEQKRIVAKVDELMALCDQLELQQQERDTRQAALCRASLARFADAPTPENLELLFYPPAPKHSTFIPQPSSFLVPPADLRKTILTLAVQGKLVPQDSNDEPAERSFSGLKALKAESHETEVLPKQWKQCSYHSLTSLVTSGSRGWKEFYSDRGAIFIRTQNIKTDALVLDDVAFVDLPESTEGKRAQALKDDILITITGANVTKAARVESELLEAYISQHIALTRPRWSESSPWLHLCFISPGSARGSLEQLAYGDKPGLNLNNIRDLVVPIPPLAEQRRIVAKVDQLMTLVDELEAQIAASRATAKNLLEALVAELTSLN